MVEQVARRRSRQNNEDETQLHNHSYSYKARLSREGTTLEIPVCYKAFLSLHGITARCVQFLQTHLTEEGSILHDQRGKHKNRPKQLSQETTSATDDHIKSLKTRSSDYSLHHSKKLYMPEELNIIKLHSMYLEKNPSLPVSYETGRYIFSHKYNISFGYPRTDTCSTCDAFTAEIRVLELKLSDSSVDKQIIEKEIKSLTTQNKLHKKKAGQCLLSKKAVRASFVSKKDECEAVCMDFQKNLKLPNISTHDVYYKRQLSYYNFNIHTLSNSDAIFYAYDETIGKKGSEDVASMLYDFIFFHLSLQKFNILLYSATLVGDRTKIIY